MKKSVRSFKSGAQAGFTLVELVVVIVILGILAATAIPKFIDMATDARVSKMQAAAGAVKAGAALYHAQWLVNDSPADGGSISMDGIPILGKNGYPDATADGIQRAAGLDGNEYTFDKGVVTIDATKDRTKCTVTYVAAASKGAAPTITVEANSSTCK